MLLSGIFVILPSAIYYFIKAKIKGTSIGEEWHQFENK